MANEITKENIHLPHQDPKYEFKDGRLWHRKSNYFIPDDEPVMVLRGKDQVSISAIEAYIKTMQSVVPQTEFTQQHIDSVTERLNAFKSFQEQYPQKVKLW